MNRSDLCFKNRFKSDRGASSVLVVLILLVLVVLGLAALTTSLASYRLGEKSGEWYVQYYKLDAKAERTISDIFGYIEDASILADGYDDEKIYPDLISKFKDQKRDLLFYYFLNDSFKNSDIKAANNGISTEVLMDNFDEGYIPTIGFDIFDDSVTNKKLEVEIQLISVDDNYDIKIIGWREENTN